MANPNELYSRLDWLKIQRDKLNAEISRLETGLKNDKAKLFYDWVDARVNWKKEAGKRLDEFLAMHKNWRRPDTDQPSVVCDTMLRARIEWFPLIWEWWGFLSPKDDESKVLFRCGGHSPEEVLGLLCGVLNRMCNNMNEGEDNDKRRAGGDPEAT